MSEQADPWDDSALLNAFDNAIAKYKMHKKPEPSHPSLLDEACPVATTSPENGVNDSSITEENHRTEEHDKQTPQQNIEDESNELYKQYYELEEQRQKVLQKLQQSGYWNHQYAGEGTWGTYSTQQHQYMNQQASHPAVTSYCCPCVCPCFATPSSSMPACSLGEPTSQAPVQAHSLEDDAIVKTAIGAAERAIASMNLNTSSDNIHQGSSEVQMTQNISPEEDLSVVLNAWYLAGFYTGKYLSGQSNAKGKHG